MSNFLEYKDLQVVYKRYARRGENYLLMNSFIYALLARNKYFHETSILLYTVRYLDDFPSCAVCFSALLWTRETMSSMYWK
jgi:hypothetical protein